MLALTCSAIGKDKEVTCNKLTVPTKLCPTSNDVKRAPPSVTLHKPPSSIAPSATTPKLVRSPPLTSIPRCGASVKREKSPSSMACTSPAKKPRSSPDVCRPIGETKDIAKPQQEQTKPLRTALEPQKRPSVVDLKRRHASSADEAKAKRPSLDSTTTFQKSSPPVSPSSVRAYSSSCGCPSSTSVTDSSRRGSLSVSPQQVNPLLSLYDPYCISCQGPHVAGNPCYENLKTHQFPFYPFSPASTYPLYAQMFMAAAARNGAAVDPTPHVCNWVNSGSGSCGKRFATADELFSHLRTHAVSSAPANAGSNYLLHGLDKISNPYAAYLSQQAAALAAVSPTAAAPVGSNFLSRSHSPLSRYNPYKAPNVLGQLPGVPSIPVGAGVGPYCSPFALYGQRLGAAAAGFSYPWDYSAQISNLSCVVLWQSRLFLFVVRYAEACTRWDAKSWLHALEEHVVWHWQ